MNADVLDLRWREWRRDDETERNYVLSSWLRSYAECPEFRSLARSVYFEIYTPVVERLLARSTVVVAWTPDLPETVIGWMAIEGDDVLHYVLVKRRFRRLGIGRWMTRDLAQLSASFTHQPALVGSRLVGDAWTYDPMRRFDRKAA